MNGLAASAVLNWQLTSFATGFMNDLARTQELAERLCPLVAVPGSSGQYKQFDDANSFSVYNTARGMGSDPTSIEFGASDARFLCTEQALQVKVDIAERRLVGEANQVGQQLLDEGKIRALVNSRMLSAAHKRVSFVVANLGAEAGLGVWSNDDIDPIDQLDKAVDDLALVVGSDANIKITMDRSAWRTLRNHKKVKERSKYSQAAPISLDQLRNDLLATPVDVGVYAISYRANADNDPLPAKPGNAGAVKKRLLTGNVIIHVSMPETTVYDPSAFKCFMPSTNAQVRSYMAPNGLWGGHLMDWAEDIRQTGTAAAKRIALS